jgi:hypothetical protein
MTLQLLFSKVGCIESARYCLWVFGIVSVLFYEYSDYLYWQRFISGLFNALCSMFKINNSNFILLNL